MGLSLLGKADQNINFDKTHYSLAYGFHATGRLNIMLSGKNFLSLEMSYNLLAPTPLEEVNMSGVILTAGLNFLSKNSRR